MQRYAMPVEMTPHEAGQLVRFADVEDALQDKERLEWVLPVICGVPEPLAAQRTTALGVAMLKGREGRALVDYARFWLEGK